MVYDFYSDFKSLLLLLLLPGLIFLTVGCSPTNEVNDNDGDRDRVAEERQEQPTAQQTQREQLAQLDPESREVRFDYENQSTRLSIPLDVLSQEFVLNLKGTPRGPVPDEVLLDDPVVKEYFQSNARKMLKHFREAQNLLYRQDYDGAMREVDRSLDVLRTADALGLKGTIFFVRGNMNSARYYWGQAVQLDPDIVIPDNPELEDIINEIREENEDEQ